MGRDWLVTPYQVLPARFIKVGLRPKSELPFQPEDERASIGPYRLRLSRVQVFSKAESLRPAGNRIPDEQEEDES